MDEMFQAAMLFWLPVALMPLGFWISNASRFPNIGKLLTITGLSLVLLSPWTVPSSPSSAVGHLLGFIIGPTILVIFGLFKIAYSGNVPVGRLPKFDKIVGIFLLLVGLTWISLMHWWKFTPVHSTGLVNVYWLIFYPTFLLSLSIITATFGFAMLVLGDDRKKESTYLFSLSAISVLLILTSMNYDSLNIESSQFREFVWLALADLVGISLGAGLAILTFAGVVFVYEKSLPEVASIDPPTNEEINLASEIIQNNLRGEEE